MSPHETFDTVLGTLSTESGWDFVVSRYDGWALTIAAGTSREYARPRAAFAGVSYFSGAMEFSHAVFQRVGDLERATIGRIVALGEDDHVVRIEAETQAGQQPQRFYLVAQEAALLGD